jgi:hypothetical protein
VTDTCGLLVGAEMHPADASRSRRYRACHRVIGTLHQLFPWVRHRFADSVYNGPIYVTRPRQIRRRLAKDFEPAFPSGSSLS